MPSGFASCSKRPSSDRTSPLMSSPMELLDKLAALIPPPRLHLLHYHGVLVPRARDRDRIVPVKAVAEPPARVATLLSHVFSADLSECAACGGRLRIIATLTDPASIRRYLNGIGLPDPGVGRLCGRAQGVCGSRGRNHDRNLCHAIRRLAIVVFGESFDYICNLVVHLQFSCLSSTYP